MKAVKEQLPASELGKDLSNERVIPVNTGPIWARIRQIESRLNAIEERTSTVRRDCDRIEKKMSREAAALQPQQENTQIAGIPQDILEAIGGL